MAEALQTADFDYQLPHELIAQKPLARRDDSRLLVLDRGTGVIHHSKFRRLGDWIAPGDLFVANNSKVIPARLRAVRLGTGGKIEILLLRRREDGTWTALAKPAKRLKPGDEIEIAPRSASVRAATAVVLDNLGHGELVLQLGEQVDEQLDAYGELPIPPYIESSPRDPTRYQTVYAAVPGSAAAPTAGMHFTPDLIADLRSRGFEWAEVTLHVGLDTFRPVTEDCVADHPIHEEWCEVPLSTAQAIAACRRRGSRVVAVGTTVARTLETLGDDWQDDAPATFSGFTRTFILPGHQWKLVDALLTNFHLPRSTLLMLVSALAGKEAIMEAYAEAVRNRYRFYSFGDAMLIR
ncbi:MAG TPA: tRNA preQ1(34) S-adenosylmethionine ribosyltransferase-isomerase QueA [Thermomicrobiales bacterium]|nr:tRNA preQ1(34) S-adenosylmethionine ribosyltransferase-isomerase QueA [Thermomicrobiales bacterium]